MDGKQIGIVAAAGALIAGGAYYLGAHNYRQEGRDTAVNTFGTVDQAPNDGSRGTETNGSLTPKVTLTARWLTGSWVLAAKGGEDGKTRCDDFARPSLYKLNDKTAKVMTFRPDRQYRDMFAYTTPSDQEHHTMTSATWEIREQQITLKHAIIRDAFTGEADGPVIISAKAEGDNVLRLDSDLRYVRCVGETDQIYGE